MVNAGIEAENFIEKGILKIIDAQTAKQLKAQPNLESMDPWYQTICKTIKQAKAKTDYLSYVEQKILNRRNFSNLKRWSIEGLPASQ